jgi:putative ABC transport system permease protein
MNVWSLALRNVARNRRRTCLSGGVVVFGFAAFALAGGFMAQSLEGLRESTIRGGVGHVQFARPAGPSGGDAAPLEHGLERADEIQAVLRRDAAVVEVLPRIDFVGLVTNGKRSIPFLGQGLDPLPESRTMDAARELAAGRWLGDRRAAEVVLGSGLAGALSAGLGDVVTLMATTTDGVLNAVDAEVVGLCDLPMQELNDRFLATSLGLAGELLGATDRVSKIVVLLRRPQESRAALPRLSALLRHNGFDVPGRTWDEIGVFYRQVRLLYVGIFGFMGSVLVVVVLLASTNAMLMATAERTREIGTLRALGARPARIRRMFVLEGALVAAGGCVVGALLSLALRSVLNNSGIVLPPPPGAAHGTPLHVKLYGVAYASGALAMLATMMLASYVPARRASRTPIVDALTHV